MKRLFAGVGVLGFVISAAAQGPIPEAQARDWASYAVGKASGDPKVFGEQFTRLVRILAPAYRADPFSSGVTIHRSDDLDIELYGPVSAFQLSMAEAVRKMTSTDGIAWPCGAMIMVDPPRIDSPDIEKIVVKRDGRIIEPITSRLVPTKMTTLTGASTTLHSGALCYALSTFAPGAAVVVIAIPATGTNITKTLGDPELRMVI